MSPNELNEQLKQTVSQLSEPESLHGLFREVSEGDPLPSAPVLAEIIDLCRAILFPGFYGKSLLSRETLPYHIGVSLDRLSHLLTQQVLAGLCFQRTEPVETCKLTEKAQTITGEFIADDYRRVHRLAARTAPDTGHRCRGSLQRRPGCRFVW